MENKFDIVIVGAGAVGLSLACALANQAKFKILLIDKRDLTAPAKTGRSMALSFSSERFYKRFDLEDFAKVATPIEEVITTIQGQFGSLRMRASEMQVMALGQVISLDFLENTLRKKLLEFNNIKSLSETYLESIAHPAKPLLKLKNKSGQILIEAKLVIGTDGSNSQVALNAGINYSVTEYGHQALINHVTTSKSHQNRAFERFTQSGALALLPYGPCRNTFIWTVPPDKATQLIAMSDEAYLEAAEAQFGFKLGKWLNGSPRVTYPLTQRIAHKSVHQRLVLMGNSAHTLHPVAAQGLNLSVRDISSFVKCISNTDINDDVAISKSLEAYKKQVKQDQHLTITMTNFIAKQVSNHRYPASLKALILRGLDHNELIKKAITRAAMGLNR